MSGAISVKLVGTDGTMHDLVGNVGQTIKDLAKDAGVEGIQGICGGEASCGTCQISVEPRWRGCLPQIGEEEQDMLDFAAIDGAEYVRLSCQIMLTEAMDGICAKVVAE